MITTFEHHCDQGFRKAVRRSDSKAQPGSDEYKFSFCFLLCFYVFNQLSYQDRPNLDLIYFLFVFYCVFIRFLVYLLYFKKRDQPCYKPLHSFDRLFCNHMNSHSTGVLYCLHLSVLFMTLPSCGNKFLTRIPMKSVMAT